MVCKEDVVSWFKELESYKRIDAMCSLLNMCLPFELRFVGTYLEELGKRDFQELRGAELRANNLAELAADIGGANTDHRTRRKMALYVSLLRSCNYACAITLYNVMLSLEQTGLLGGIYGDPLEELLLLYTMALHHPAFTFDQHSHIGKILEELNQRNQYTQPSVTMNSAPSGSGAMLHPTVTPNLSVPPPNVSGLTPMSGLVYVKAPPLQGPPIGSEQIGELVNPLSVPSNPMAPANEVMYPLISEGIPPPPGLPVSQYNMADFVINPVHWPAGLIMTTINQPVDLGNYPPPPSPLVSQPSSPCDSRSGSPGARPPPPPPPPLHRAPPTPPPQQQQPQQQEHYHYLVPAFTNLNLDERHSMDEKVDFQMKAVAQLEKLNGMRRLSHGSRKPANTYCSTQRMQQQSSGSESGSSTGSHSPPDTPAPAQPHPGRPRQPPSPHYFPQPFPRTAIPASFSYRQAFAPFTPNGEAPLFGGQYPGYVPVALYQAPPKLSCWNCGALGHSGTDCKEPSIEEMTRAGCYQLDYSSAPPDINDK